MTLSRRHLLKGIGAGALSAATLTTLGNAMYGFQAANAAEVTGYKALVCIFLLGGCDTHDVLLPYDQSSYDSFRNIRSSMFGGYNGSRDRSQLLQLSPTNASDFGGRQFALPPEMSGVHDLFQSGNAAFVANTGPLIRPLNRSQWQSGTVPVPKQLFSHNDQQSTWAASAPEGAQYGWGGRFADASVLSGANTNREFSTITTVGNELFLTGQEVLPYQIGTNGADEIDILDDFSNSDITNLLRRHFSAADSNDSNLIEKDVARIADKSVVLNEAYNQAVANLVPISTQFPQSYLGSQMKAIANAIAIRDSLSVRRQVFFAAIGGFDTHSTQAADLPGHLSEVSAAITAFYAAMQELGVGNDVTTFTASDFGRTLAANGDGTDHGWGSHHLVVGGAVQGQRIYGDVPPAEFGHDQDADSGRLIPTISVEQYAEPLGRWFGLSDNELAAALPNLSNFTGTNPAQNIL
ncbi:DUF1501 domain-containing protein [Hyphomonas sp.]|jgi:uncharacterized protein (DUF1501 family)|uniref:DUF1501 domain-containing protein n=1 Tax=Hyphomonas sp. TaxID=87 RepID=UPI000C69B349|nr:DUF1501 domain-containing protein [Hyphomonas sp.]MAB09418.1 hypothetical protein [Hyphomonas sp.]MAU68213.1 hypothetical protein [Hyphomonas sp.]